MTASFPYGASWLVVDLKVPISIMLVAGCEFESPHQVICMGIFQINLWRLTEGSYCTITAFWRLLDFSGSCELTHGVQKLHMAENKQCGLL